MIDKRICTGWGEFPQPGKELKTDVLEIVHDAHIQNKYKFLEQKKQAKKKNKRLQEKRRTERNQTIIIMLLFVIVWLLVVNIFGGFEL